MEISTTEKRVLQSIHLRGCSGSMGSMNLKQRKALITGLIAKKLMTDKLILTPLGLKVSR